MISMHTAGTGSVVSMYVHTIARKKMSLRPVHGAHGVDLVVSMHIHNGKEASVTPHGQNSSFRKQDTLVQGQQKISIACSPCQLGKHPASI
jgi:hypothetical protein